MSEAAVRLFEEIVATPGVCGIDFETTIARAYERRPCTVQVAHEDGREAVVWGLHLDPRLRLRVALALTDSPCEFAAHFAVFEWGMFHVLGARPQSVNCTYVAARVLRGAMIGTDDEDDEEFGGWALEDVAGSLLGMDFDKQFQKADWTEPMTPEREEYGLQDARGARDVWIALAMEFERDPDQRRGFDVVNDAIPVIARCNLHGGFRFDRDAHNALCVRMQDDLEGHSAELDVYSRCEVENHNSAKQVSTWVAGRLFGRPEQPQHVTGLLFKQATGEDWPLTATRQLTLGKKVLQRLLETLEYAFPDVGRYVRTRLAYQKEAKLLQAFGPKLALTVDADGCIRCSLIPHGARTSRMSARDPNLQQMPTEEEFRACFLARRGRVLVICDYGQIELRVGCIIADDKAMQAIFSEGVDIHAVTAVLAFKLAPPEVLQGLWDELARTGDAKAFVKAAAALYDPNDKHHVKCRKRAKAPNFAALYGAEAYTVALNAAMSVGEARVVLDQWLDTYPGIARFRREMPEIGRQQGYVQIASGQKIAVVDSTRPAQMINAPVQGGSASVMYRAAVRVARRYEEEGIDAVLFMLVHDELITDAHPDHAVRAAQIKQEEMTAALLEFFPRAAELGVESVADASICESWADKDNPECKLHRYIERMAS